MGTATEASMGRAAPFLGQSRRRCSAVLAVSAVLALALHLQGCGPPAPEEAECKDGAEPAMNCKEPGCCKDPKLTCYEKDSTWASCMESCTPGKHDEDPEEFRTPWSCEVLKPQPPTTTIPPPKGWISGTWTTGYWDCCKPSCSWEGKGKVDKPVRSCDARTGKTLEDANEKSVCEGGQSATCTDMAPFVVNDGLAMGFAAGAVGAPQHGLTGDDNCGQCYELKFVDQKHKGGWGGASEKLVGKRMIIQVTNIGKDVTGNHTFDILIPGAGQGLFDSGCKAQFPDKKTDDFDCATRYGGCKTKDGCEKLPKEMQEGCNWRYDWYDWNTETGTNNPFIIYKRVKCPHQLVALSGTTPNDDGQHEIVM